MRKILVVEDEDRLCAAIMAYLSSQGAHPIAAGTIQEAVHVLDRHAVDLIVLDLNLDNGSGLEMLRHVRGSSDLAGLPILAMSAWDMEPSSYDYLEPGDYLTKPFDMRLLDLVIRRFLELPGGRRLHRSRAVLPEVALPDAGGQCSGQG